MKQILAVGCRILADFKGADFDVRAWRGTSGMRNRLRRFYGRGDLHFITFSCRGRLPLLRSSDARNAFVSVLDEVRTQYRFRLHGFVVMPEHVHMVISEPKIGTPSDVMRALKQKVSVRVNPSKGLSGTQLDAEDDDAFWLRRFYDFNVWSSGKLEQKLDYMHRNPVKRGLVSHPKYWPWSSWSYYETGEAGLIRIDSLGDEEEGQSQNRRTQDQSQKPHP